MGAPTISVTTRRSAKRATTKTAVSGRSSAWFAAARHHPRSDRSQAGRRTIDGGRSRAVTGRTTFVKSASRRAAPRPRETVVGSPGGATAPPMTNGRQICARAIAGSDLRRSVLLASAEGAAPARPASGDARARARSRRNQTSALQPLRGTGRLEHDRPVLERIADVDASPWPTRPSWMVRLAVAASRFETNDPLDVLPTSLRLWSGSSGNDGGTSSRIGPKPSASVVVTGLAGAGALGPPGTGVRFGAGVGRPVGDGLGLVAAAQPARTSATARPSGRSRRGDVTRASYRR